jgi:DNA-binding NarL/FixJ family response regulator
MQRPRIVLAEDHAEMAEQLRSLLAAEFDVVAVVGDGQALLRAVEAAQPDVVVSDSVMPEMDGIAATAALLAKQPSVRVVVVTVHDEPELVERGQAAGALGFVSKHRAGYDLIPAVKAALRGERYVSRRARNGRS